MNKKLSITTAIIMLPAIINNCFAQDSLTRTLPPGYDPHYNKVIPDKVFEIGLPLLVLYLISNAVVNIFRVRAENRLKEKALDKQLSEATMIQLFAVDKTMSKYIYLKYFLVLAALGISFVTIQLLANASFIYSGYMAVGIIALYMSVAFLIYFFIIRRK